MSDLRFFAFLALAFVASTIVHEEVHNYQFADLLGQPMRFGFLVGPQCWALGAAAGADALTLACTYHEVPATGPVHDRYVAESGSYEAQAYAIGYTIGALVLGGCVLTRHMSRLWAGKA